jgi:aminotransferase
VDLYPPLTQNSDWSFNPNELRAAFNQKTRAIVINTPHNPTGKVFTREELQLIADLCNEFDAIAITDEIYEHILYDGHQHISIASLPEMRARTVTISSLSKTYSVTGWRVGWAIAAPELTLGIRKVHDFLTVGAAAPLQAAGAAALSLPQSYYDDLAAKYTERRDLLLNGLRNVGLTAFRPRGAYYIIADFSPVFSSDDTSFAMHLLEKISVAAVPGSSFYRKGSGGSKHIRFTFCKKLETLQQAIENLRKL